MFTPVFTPAIFPGPIERQIFQQIAVPQAQLQFAGDPLSPKSGHRNDDLQHSRQVRKASAAWIVHIVRLLLRTVGGES
jgi:hypothetical protein